MRPCWLSSACAAPPRPARRPGRWPGSSAHTGFFFCRPPHPAVQRRFLFFCGTRPKAPRKACAFWPRCRGRQAAPGWTPILAPALLCVPGAGCLSCGPITILHMRPAPALCRRPGYPRQTRWRFHAHWHRAPQVLRCGTVQPIYRSGFAHRSKLHKIPAFAFDKFSANFP